MPHVFRWLLGTLVFGIVGGIATGLILNTMWGLLFYVPYAVVLAERARQTHRLRHGQCWAVWTGEEYPWGTLHHVYAVRSEAEQAVTQLAFKGQHAYITTSLGRIKS